MQNRKGLTGLKITKDILDIISNHSTKFQLIYVCTFV